MKDNVKVIHFYIKSRGVQSLVFVQITFEEYTKNLYFENGGIGTKNNNCQFATLISMNLHGMKRFRIFKHFYAVSFSIKACFVTPATFFMWSVRQISQNC